MTKGQGHEHLVWTLLRARRKGKACATTTNKTKIWKSIIIWTDLEETDSLIVKKKGKRDGLCRRERGCEHA
jgi:hypothetical protein